MPSSVKSGGHPDVGEQHVGPVLVDGREQLGEVGRRGDHVDVVDAVEQGEHPGPEQVAVLGQDDSDLRHAGTVATEPMPRR